MIDLLLQNEFLSAIIAFALILIPAIIIHELGHFFAAKAIGVNVLEFGIGFPPRLARIFMWGETEFTINWLPIGGFVRPLGEDMLGPVNENQGNYAGSDDEEKQKNEAGFLSERDELRARGIRDEDMMSVNEAKPWPRIFFMAAGPFANFASAVLLFMIIALIGLPQIVGARLQVADIAPGSAFSVEGVSVGDAIERINGEYFTSATSFFEQLQAGSGQSLILDMRNISNSESYQVSIMPDVNAVSGYVFVGGVAAGSPAEDAGLLTEDLITQINGENMGLTPVETLQQAVEENAGSPVDLTVLRGTESFNVVLVPRLDPPAGQGRVGLVIDTQFAASDGARFINAPAIQELIPQSLQTSIQYGFERTGETLGLILSLPSQLINGSITPEEARPVSIVGISQIGGQFLRQSVEQGSPIIILNFLALISIFLGFTNLLPLPPLDGGRILFILIEIVRGKPVPIHIETFIYRAGMIFLLSLGLMVILYDIFNPFVLP